MYLNNYEHKESFQHNNKKKLDIDMSDSGLLINNELLLEFSVSRLTEIFGKPRITSMPDKDSSYKAMYLWDSRAGSTGSNAFP